MFMPQHLDMFLGSWSEKSLRCFQCTACKPGEIGVELYKGVCLHHCSQNHTCGKSSKFQVSGSVDCRDCENAPLWSDLVREMARRACRQHDWPRVPLRSYTYHIGFETGNLADGRWGIIEKDPVLLEKIQLWGEDAGAVDTQSRVGGFHFHRDHLDELGLRFQFDEYNMKIKRDLEPQVPAGVQLVNASASSVEHTRACFDGPHHGHYLISCAVDDRVVFRSCMTFKSLASAQSACLKFDSCGGVTEIKPRVFTLRSGSKIVRMPASLKCSDWILPRSWVRRRIYNTSISSTGPAGRGTKSQLSPAAWLRCSLAAPPEMRHALQCAQCSECNSGSKRDGGVAVACPGCFQNAGKGVCQAFCSSSGFCGISYSYSNRGTDCRACKHHYNLSNSKSLAELGLIRPLQQIGTEPAAASARRRVLYRVASWDRYGGDSKDGGGGSKDGGGGSKDTVARPGIRNVTFERTGLHPPSRPKGTDQVTSWGVVLPFHGKAGSQRLKLMNATWHSLCRAMRYADESKSRLYEFNVLAIDDTGTRINASSKFHSDRIDGSKDLSRNWKRTATHTDVPNFENAELQERWSREWRDSCAAASLKLLVRIEGKKNISENVKLGFEWAAKQNQFDFVTNFDSDLLVTKSFFIEMEHDYWRAREYCDAPAISGYTSNIMPKRW